jgi:hypothetical protein
MLNCGYLELLANANLKSRMRENCTCGSVRGGTIFYLSHDKENIEKPSTRLFTEWNWDDAIAVRCEEAREDGIGIGEARGETRAREELFALLESGVSLADAKQRFGL